MRITLNGIEYVRADVLRGESGDSNIRNRNTGHGNTGSRNTGDWNTGNRNTGNSNTGNLNTGYRNTGHGNTGSSNTGSWNTGDSNTGDWNTGNWNTGYLNTEEPDTVRIFNKDTEVKKRDLIFPDYFYFDITEWVSEAFMTDKEKEENPTYTTTGGYLKEYEYQEAWRKSWENTTDEDRRRTLELPNWSNEIFKEISGIDVEKELGIEKAVLPIKQVVRELTIDEIAEKFNVDASNIRIRKD